MKQTTFTFVVLLFQLVSAKVEWRFQGTVDDGIWLEEALVGTPGQKVTPRLVMNNDKCPGLWIQGQFSNPFGFNLKKSSTFNERENIYNSVFGYEDLWVNSAKGQKQELKEKSINVMDRVGYCQTDYSFFSLTHANSLIQNNFINSVIEKDEERVVVMTYDNVPSEWNSNFTGVLTFGNVPLGCQGKWIYPQEVKPVDPNFPQWNFQMDKLVAENYTLNQLKSAVFHPFSSNIQIPKDFFNEIITALGMKEDNGVIDCNSQSKITVTIAGMELTLRPEDLGQKWNNECTFHGTKSDTDLFVLPYTLLRNQCIGFDYKSGQIGFSVPSLSTTTNYDENTTLANKKMITTTQAINANEDFSSQSTLSQFLNNKIEQTTQEVEIERASATKKLFRFLNVFLILLFMC